MQSVDLRSTLMFEEGLEVTFEPGWGINDADINRHHDAYLRVESTWRHLRAAVVCCCVCCTDSGDTRGGGTVSDAHHSPAYDRSGPSSTAPLPARLRPPWLQPLHRQRQQYSAETRGAAQLLQRRFQLRPSAVLQHLGHCQTHGRCHSTCTQDRVHGCIPCIQLLPLMSISINDHR